MSTPPDRPDDEPADADARLFAMLDGYVEALHRGEGLTRSQLWERHPELADLLRCLDSLECLAPATDEPPADSAAMMPTLIAGNGDHTRGTAEERPVTGRRFGKYELQEEIGRGGMGVVYRAWQTDLNRPVAVKMILASRLASNEDVRRFYAEARAAGSLRHPNIIGIHEVGAIDGQHYFAMDCVEGESLDERLRHGPLDAETAARLVAAVARAVQYLHQHNIIHRDLKPSNILLDRQGQPYVTDFGLAKIFTGESARTQTGTIVGTPSYMPPEQAAGRPADLSPRSDVYSLGAILYELLAGRPPFQRDNPLDTLVDVLEGEPTLLTKIDRQIPRGLEWIAFRCLEKDPRQRYPTAAALADDLERYLRDEPVEAQPSGLAQRVRRWTRREPALVAHLGALLPAAAIIQIKYTINGTDWPYHVQVMLLMGAWAVVSFFFQRLLHRDRWADLARFGWSACDAVLLTALLYIASAATPLGPTVIGYPLLVVASGMFFHVRLVWFTTLVSLVSYAVLVALHPHADPVPMHYPVLFATVLAVLGGIVSYQVHRVRMLSRYFEDRRFP